MAKRILVPLDETPAAQSVTEVVAEMARGGGATVRLLRVAPEPGNVMSGGDRGADVGPEAARLPGGRGGAARGGRAGRAARGRGAPRRDPRRVRRPLRRPGGGDPARGGGLRRGPDRTHDEDGEQPHAGGAGQRGRAGVP